MATLVDSVYIYNTTLWHQYRSAKKVEILTLTKIDFSKEKCHEKRLSEQFSSSKFKNFLGGHAPRPPYQLAPLAMAMAAKAPSTKLFQQHLELLNCRKISNHSHSKDCLLDFFQEGAE